MTSSPQSRTFRIFVVPLGFGSSSGTQLEEARGGFSLFQEPFRCWSQNRQ